MANLIIAKRFCGPPTMLLAQYTAQVERLAKVDEPCTVVGWHIGSSGRKHETGTALFGADGELCGRAWAMWIELRASGA